MNVFLSTESTVKHDAVKLAFAEIGINVETHAMPVASGVSEQPTSLDETYEGALNRHEKLVSNLGEKAKNSCLVTIESGIFVPRPELNYFGTTTLFVDWKGERHVGIDVDIEFPKSMTDRVPGEYKDLGELVKQEYGATVSDPFPYFTNGQITRAKILQDALWRVLIQFDDLTTSESKTR
jgi:non-canonical (house-cleaning) NTP pyrophosphatase